MSAPTATPPITTKRLEQIANDACTSALEGSQFYEHSKTELWNTTIINSILKALISESAPPGAQPAYKFAVNSTIIQHLVPSSALSRARPATASAGTSTSTGAEDGGLVKSEATGTDGKPHVGRRGMHSATGAYWNDKTDGMWSFKFEGGEEKGLDVVISVIWIGL